MRDEGRSDQSARRVSADDVVNPIRAEERSRVRGEIEARLRDRDIRVRAEDTDDAITYLLDSVEDFEREVQLRGGDLMVDTPPAREPERAEFVLPNRGESERIDDYRLRVEAATQLLRRHDR